MEKSNSTRGDERHHKEGDFEFYLKSGLPAHQVVSMLRSMGKDQKEVDAFVEKYEASRKKIAHLIKKFAAKIEQRYGHLDTPELMKKGLKFASKHNFSPAEKEAFVRFVMKGDTESPYLPFQELGYTEMSKFMGFSSFPGQTMSVKATDHPALQEIARLYEMSKSVHTAIRSNLLVYRSCGPDAMDAKFDKDKHNASIFVHPLLVALFLSKIDALEKRMLASNIGRMVVMRTQAYFQSQDDRKMSAKYLNWNLSLNDLLPGELESDLQLAYDIARDPNSLNNFSNETPMTNLLKRFTIQIALWKNVLLLRQGKFFSKSESFSGDDGILELQNVLASYDWTYFDSPDLYQVHDEGTMLRKLLAVFSLRPTFTQISAFVHRTGLGYSNIGAVSRATFVNTPVCNIKLPISAYGSRTHSPIRLTSALEQSDWFIENKMLVPKNKAVIHSRDVIFFYVNRRYQSPLANVDMGFRYLSLPGSLSNMTKINTTELAFGDSANDLSVQIGNDTFNLVSVVVLNPLLDGQLATGCSSIVVSPVDYSIGRTRPTYFYYNPLGSSVLHEISPGTFARNEPISLMPEHSADPRIPGFFETARKFGTVFVYSK